MYEQESQEDTEMFLWLKLVFMAVEVDLCCFFSPSKKDLLYTRGKPVNRRLPDTFNLFRVDPALSELLSMEECKLWALVYDYQLVHCNFIEIILYLTICTPDLSEYCED